MAQEAERMKFDIKVYEKELAGTQECETIRDLTYGQKNAIVAVFRRFGIIHQVKPVKEKGR